MYRRLCVPDPIREITDVTIKGWPVIISHGILLGTMAIHPMHRMNVTGKYEIHIAKRSYADLTINLLAWPMLEAEINQLNKAIAQIKGNHE